MRRNKTGIDRSIPSEENLRLITYRSWYNMRARCRSRDPENYKYYGAKGIKVCDRWEESFLNFVEDMGIVPYANWSLDRIDAGQDYTRENCRWASPMLQNLNRDFGETQGIFPYGDRWRAQIRLGGKALYLGTYDDPETAMSYRKVAEKVIDRLIEMEVIV